MLVIKHQFGVGTHFNVTNFEIIRILNKIVIMIGEEKNEFELTPSEKNKIGRSRIYVESEEDGLILGFKVFNTGEFEIIKKW